MAKNIQTITMRRTYETLSIKFEVQQKYAVGRGKAAPLMRHAIPVKGGLTLRYTEKGDH